MSACLADLVSRDTQVFQKTGLHLYTGPELDPKDIAVTKRCVEDLIGLGIPYLTNLFKRIDEWRNDVVTGKNVYEERDERCLRYALEMGLAMYGGSSWDAIVAIAEREGSPIRGLDELIDLLEEDEKMLHDWLSPILPTPVLSAEEITAQFRLLARQWREDVEVESSITRMTRHPAYRQIIGMGEVVIPLILTELKRQPEFWFAALRELTGVNPVPNDAAGKIAKMTKAWLEWGREKGYIK